MESLMTMEPRTVNNLDRLVRANRDSAAALRESADAVEGELISRILARVARERAGFAEELAAYLDLNDVTPRSDGSLLESARRVWSDLRARMAGGDAGVVLTQIERSEATLMRAYEQVLRATAGSPANATLMRHYAAIKKTHDALDDLRAVVA